jgi:hypothetical protein
VLAALSSARAQELSSINFTGALFRKKYDWLIVTQNIYDNYWFIL